MLEHGLSSLALDNIIAAITAIEILGTMANLGDPDTGDLGHIRSMVVGSESIPVPTDTDSGLFTTTIHSHVIAATSAAIVNKGTALGLGKVAVSADGVPLSLSTSETFVEVSRTQTFETESVHIGAVMTGSLVLREHLLALLPRQRERRLQLELRSRTVQALGCKPSKEK